MENKNFKKYWIVAAGALVVLGLAIWYFLPKGDQEMYNRSFSEGRDLFKGGDTSSVVRFEEAVRNAPTKADEALAKVNLGAAYLLSDPARGVGVLKEVAGDESYPAFYRAGAINYIVQHTVSRGDVQFEKEQVYVGDIWSDFYEESAGTPKYVHDLAARRAYEWSTSLFSTFPAEYWLAVWHAGKGNANPSNDVKEEYFRIARERIAKGDVAYQAASKAGRTPVSQLGAGKVLRGQALGYLYMAGVFDKQEEIEASFREAIQLLDQDPSDFNARGEALFARFYLAGGIAADGVRREGVLSSARKEAVRPILAPIYKYEFAGLFEFLKGRADEKVYTTGNDTVKYLAALLAEADPQFKQLLEKLGWGSEDFKL